MIVKIGGMGAGLFVSVFLGRTLGANGLGIIDLANRIITLLLVISMLGMDQVLIKHIAIAYESKYWQQIKSSIFTSTIINGLISLAICIIGIIFSPFFSNHIFKEPQLITPLRIAFIAIIPQTISRIYGSGLIGIRKIWQSNLVNETLSMWIISIILITLYFLNVKLNVINVAIIYAIGRVTVTFSILSYWKNNFPYKINRNWLGKPMLKMALPLLLVTSTSVIAANSSLILLGWIDSTYNVGLYSVATRLALLVSFFLQITNAAISPKLAALFSQNQLIEMEKMVQRVTTGLIVIAVICLLFFAMLGNWILSFWGENFKEAFPVLLILAIGQFFNIATGCAGLLLIMCGHEKDHSRISILFLLLNLILNIILIKYYGIVGAATATTITVIGENIVKFIFVKKRIGILTMRLKK